MKSKKVLTLGDFDRYPGGENKVSERKKISKGFDDNGMSVSGRNFRGL